ncbi:ATP/GTP-binding protein [Streptomyces sp. NPDC001787]|uniref:GTP-binding protein n=1 Tax=Streptomyces sp. NPDC001787 TaxID=3154523 RepID=UPI00332AAA3C
MRPEPAAAAPPVIKLMIAGGFGAGKTTMVGAVSEFSPLMAEERLTVISNGTDSLEGVAAKTTTTVAFDVGRITLRSPQMILMLFGTPGQERFWFLWDDLTVGTSGAVVLADTRRLADSYAALDHFDRHGVPFVVAVNEFADAPFRYTPQEVGDALGLDGSVPVLLCDARDRRSVADVLKTLVGHALAHHRSGPPTAFRRERGDRT